MSEKNETIEVAIENKLKGVLSGDILKNALDFTAYLKEIGMTYDKDNRFYYMGEYTCILIFFKDEENPSGLWVICDCPITEHDGYPLDDDLKEFARANVMICNGQCGCKDWPRGGDKTIFGQEYKSVCSSEIQFINPDAEALVKVKKLMEFWKYIIENSKK